jgi:WD40 repeat protein
MTDEATHPIIRNSIPVRKFDDLGEVAAVAVFPDRRRMATNSSDGMVRIWDLKNGVLLKELEGRGDAMVDITLSRDGQLIASSDHGGYVIAWHGDTGKALTPPFQAHQNICSLDFSPDGAMLATGSTSDYTIKLWSAETWQLQGSPIHCSYPVYCVRYSPSGKLLAVATNYYIQVWDPYQRASIANFGKDQTVSLVWTPDGTRLLSGDYNNSSIREWDSSTWMQVGEIWKGHTGNTWRIAVNCDGTVIASPTTDNRVRLWRLSDRRTIAIFQHSGFPCCITFSVDGKHILAGGKDKRISEWAVPKHAWPGNALMDLSTHVRIHFQSMRHLILLIPRLKTAIPKLKSLIPVRKTLTPTLKMLKPRYVSNLKSYDTMRAFFM